MVMPARMLFPPWSVHRPCISADRIPRPASNDTQRTRPQPGMEHPGWTCLAIFSKSGITRRETPHVPDLRALCSVHLLCTPRCFISSHFISAVILPSVVKSTSKCTPSCCVFQDILTYSVSYTPVVTILSLALFLSLSPSFPIGLRYPGSSSSPVASLYTSPFIEDLVCQCPFVFFLVTRREFRSFMW